VALSLSLSLIIIFITRALYHLNHHSHPRHTQSIDLGNLTCLLKAPVVPAESSGTRQVVRQVVVDHRHWLGPLLKMVAGVLLLLLVVVVQHNCLMMVLCLVLGLAYMSLLGHQLVLL
jgi:hypothetical protein